MGRYVIGFLLAVGLIVVVIVLIVRGLMSGPQTSSTPGLDLNRYAGTSTSMRLTIDTPVAAAETHRDIVITVGNNDASLKVTKGYDGQVVRQQGYPMNSVSYAVFLRALALNGFANGDNTAANRDERGHCALGDRYIYEVIDGNGDTLQHYWYTSCGNGTFKGNVNAIRGLFRKQIPDYDKLTSDVQL